MKRKRHRKKSMVTPGMNALVGGVRDGDLRTAMPLDQFLTQVGLVMKLPTHPDLDAVAPAPVKKQDEAKVRRTRWWLPVGAVAALLTAIGARLDSPGAVESPTAPAELVGTWHTAAPGYADRSLTIEAGAITISVGDTLLQRFPIAGVAGGYSREGSRYVIRYRTNEGVVEFPVTSQGMFLQMPNPKGAQWTRETVRTTAAGRARRPTH